MEKLELKHLAPYLPYDIRIQYIGVLNGKELGKWERQNKELGVFEEPTIPYPTVNYGYKIGLIKKVETYLNYWKLRVGNGHKNIYPLEIGRTAFLILKPIDFKIEYELRRWDAFEKLFSEHYDVFGLIEKGLAIDINTLTNEELTIKTD